MDESATKYKPWGRLTKPILEDIKKKLNANFYNNFSCNHNEWVRNDSTRSKCYGDAASRETL